MIIVAAGSNKAFCGQQPAQIVTRAFQALAKAGQGMRISPLYRSPAWPDPDEPEYVNAVATFESSEHEPAEMLAMLHAIEDAFGRERAYLADPALRYAPRTLDLDLVAHGEVVSDGTEDRPVLPHPCLEQRDFVLAPLSDIAPQWCHPVSGLSVQEMLFSLPAITACRLENGPGR